MFDFVDSADFYELLNDNRKFCEILGRLMLAAGRLETKLREYLTNKKLDVRDNATLGQMVKILKNNDCLTRNGEMHFDDLVLKRNYLAHSLFDLFDGKVDQTILPSSELTADDTDYFIDCISNTLLDFQHFTQNVMGRADPSKSILL